MQSVDVAPLDVATHDFTKFFEKNVDKSKALTPQKAYQLACFDGYTLHRSPINRTDQRVLRKFVTINFAPYLYDGWGTINLHFREVYQTPVYYCREMLAWLPGGDWGRQVSAFGMSFRSVTRHVAAANRSGNGVDKEAREGGRDEAHDQRCVEKRQQALEPREDHDRGRGPRRKGTECSS